MRERIYVDGKDREYDVPREKHTSIEKDDIDLIITIQASEPPSIPMKLDMPVLEKQIVEIRRLENNPRMKKKKVKNENSKT